MVGISERARVLRPDASGVRWRHGERLDHLFEQCCDRTPDRLAVDAGDVRLTYRSLDARANRLARHLLANGVRPGDRVGLLFDDPVQTYVGMVAVLKANAVYVPLDVAFPDDRIAYIAGDAGIRVALTLPHLRDRLGDVEPLCVDVALARTAEVDGQRLTPAEKGEPVDELCYIIYTSGSTGRPKGVAVEHASICNFVRVAAEVYGIVPADRVYQGMTIAFDFSVEEIWVPWMSGATLVPKPGGAGLIGRELGEFLRDNAVTALCCVPTLLATLDEDLPGLRFLLVSGEPCPRDLVARWHRPDRRFLNVYGPTEATVTATWTTVDPDQPVTIGVPLPTYAVVILDPEANRAVGPGEIGEIGIAGIGLARGYLNRDDLTDRAFVRDFLGIEHNPSGRIYRTGDLGRVDGRGRIEYLGRIDTQVKIRGYRVELTEIESVLLRAPGVAQAVVDTYEPEPGLVELVGYYSLRAGAPAADREDILARLRAHLPAYMVPAYLECLDAIPMTPSNKADRKNLPPPAGPRSLVAARDHVAPATDAERVLADVLAEVLHVEQVSVDSDFFADLSANSLLMSRFCARAREHPALPAIAMRQVYLNPTVRALAAVLPAGPETAPPTEEPTVEPIATWRYVLCGALQALIFLGYLYFYALVADIGIGWILSAGSLVDAYLRSVAFGGAGFAAVCALPVLLKWLLVGRWRERSFPVWSLAYVRFWTVATLIRLNPMRLFVGSPLYPAYLRLLGAKIGRGTVILSHNVPVCTDLLTVGAGSVIRKDTYFTCYRAVAGRIRTGPVTLGRETFVGEATTLDIGTSMGDRSQLGHASCLHPGTSVPDGESWHGSPAQPTTVDHRAACVARRRRWSRARFSATQLLTMMGFTIPLVLLAGTLVDSWLTGGLPVDESNPGFYEDELGLTGALYFGTVVIGLALVCTLPRLLALFVRPDRCYPLYGPRYSMQRAITRFTNSRTFTYLFGDSSYIVHYLRLLGYDLGEVEQTGSNFGVEIKHESPFVSAVGAGTIVSDGLSLLNVEYSDTAFRVRRAAVGPRNFLGNNIVYPPGGRTGDNCLLATKVMIPLDGEIRGNTGLLGSPSFPIPRSVARDAGFDDVGHGAGSRRLAAKNRHNTVTLALFLLSRWGDVFGVAVINLIAIALYPRFGTPATAAGLLAAFLFVAGYGVLVERAAQGFRALRPRFCSIYDRTFWRHERFWKHSAGRYLALFNGTPFKNLLWRLLGVHIGRRVFDDGCAIPEKTLVAIGDDTVLNIGSVIQCHSLEDGVFKSDRTTIGAGCTVGTAAFVHYGVTMGDHSGLDADAFLMKGSELAPRTRWRGNPATEISSTT